MKSVTLAVLIWFCSAGFAADQADRVLVIKHERKLVLISKSREIHSYKVALGGQPVGAKTRQGDHKTPEGTYTIDSRNAHSQFYKSLHISYPNANDLKQATAAGANPGGDIFIHGLPPKFKWLGKTHTL